MTAVTFDRREGDQAVLVDAEGASYVVPATALPTGAAIGAQLHLTIGSAPASEDREALAKSILNQILKHQE